MIVDMMAFVHRYEAIGSTDYSQLQKKYLEKILRMKPREHTIVHVVGGRYGICPEQILKYEERWLQEKETRSLKTFIPHPSLPIPKWKDYIAKRENKDNLLKFLFQA